MSGNQHARRTQKVKLMLQASNLRTGSFMSMFQTKCSPFAVVTKLAPAGRSQEEPTIIGQTEPITNTTHPQWTKYFILDFDFGLEMFLDVNIYDDRDKKQMASSRIEVGSILGKRRNRAAHRLLPSGTLYSQIVPFETPDTHGTLQFTLGAVLKERSGCYYEVHRRDYFESGAIWTPVYRSKSVSCKESSVGTMRTWEKCSIPLYDIATKNMDILDCPFRVMFWNYRKVKRHEILGSIQTTISGLKAVLEKQNPMKLVKSEVVGDDEVLVMSVEISGLEDDNSVGYDASQLSLPIAAPLPLPLPAPSTRSVPMPSKRMPTFVHYISGGCELDLGVAIDFTSSNGNPLTPGTPHYIDENSLNEYEKAIIACGRIVSKYDSDQLSQVWGFGAKYDGVTRHIFQVGDKSHVHGVQGILEAYRTVFQRGLRMSSPVVYTEVIKTAAKMSKIKHEKATKEGGQSYSILLILTHGFVNDINATKAALKAAADAPLSIVLVGIGE